MNYQIVMDEKILRDFIEWLPELKETEQYYLCLFARSKYTKDLEGKNGIPHVSSDKAQLKRITSTKQRMFEKIKQMECPLGSYFQKDHAIPQEALALYITVNPRDLWKATKQSLKHFAEVVCTNGRTMNPQADAMSEIQRAKGTTHYVVADLDTKDEDALTLVQSKLDVSSYKLLETRGGYHILIDPSKMPIRSNWYMGLKAIPQVDQMGDMMIPVPGTYQGGFVPHFIN